MSQELQLLGKGDMLHFRNNATRASGLSLGPQQVAVETWQPPCHGGMGHHHGLAIPAFTTMAGRGTSPEMNFFFALRYT
jgi:hypothetical protein